MKTEAQFWARVVKCDSGCWLWNGARMPHGYGNVFFQGAYHRVHRLAYVLSHGPIPDGMFVCHTCDVRHCCNPSHLWIGTPADNVRDMMVKGRNSRNTGSPGQTNPAAKLTQYQVDEIRKLYATRQYTLKQLGATYNISKSMISVIVRGEAWKI